MTYRVTLNQDLGVVEIVFEDAISGIDFQHATSEAAVFNRKLGVGLALVDATRVVHTGSILDHYELPMQYKEEGLPHSMKVALVVPDDPDLRQMAKFYETVCLNRGWNVHCFERRDQGVEWLLSGNSPTV